MTILPNTTNLTKHPMSELGKMEEGRAKNMNLISHHIKPKLDWV